MNTSAISLIDKHCVGTVYSLIYIHIYLFIHLKVTTLPTITGTWIFQSWQALPTQDAKAIFKAIKSRSIKATYLSMLKVC
jgi:hypothetical protein